MPKAAGEGPCSEGIAVKCTPCEREELFMSLVRWQQVQCRSTFAEGVTLLLLCFMRQWSTSQEGKLQGKTPCCSCVLAGINYKQVGPWCGSHCTRAHAAISKTKGISDWVFFQAYCRCVIYSRVQTLQDRYADYCKSWVQPHCSGLFSLTLSTFLNEGKNL